MIAYGDRNNCFAGYAYWYLKYYGHDRLKLLNGPRARWIAEIRPTPWSFPNTRAKSIPWARTVNEDGLFNAVDELRDPAAPTGC